MSLNLDELDFDELFEIYKQEVNNNADLEDFAERYDIPMTKAGKLNQSIAYRKRRDQLENDLIKEINNARKSRIPPPPPPPTLSMRQAPVQRAKLVRFGVPVGQPHLTPLTEEQKLRLRNQELERENQRLRDYIIEHHPPPPPPQLPPMKPEPYGESEEFRKSHHNMSFNEYSRIKDKDRINELIEFLHSDHKEWFIDFTKFKSSSLDTIKPYIVDWFENKIGTMRMNEHCVLQFRINREWKSVPMNGTNYHQLLDKLKSGSFVYDMEKLPTFEYQAGKPIKELPEWSLFDAIRIAPINKYKSSYRDNGGHFFEYLADENLPQSAKDYLVMFQIFTTLSVDGKTQRSELDDCCFIYAVKQTGQFTEEELNLMRLRVRARYLSVGKIDAVAEEFKFKVFVNRIDPNASKGNEKRKVRVKGKDFIGYADATPEKTFHFDLYENHFMVHIDQTPFSPDFIKHIDEAPADATQKRYHRSSKNGKYYWEPCKTRISSDDLILELMNQGKFKPITYATASILKTSLYEEIKDADFPLEYDEKACLKLITNRNSEHKTFGSNTVAPTYWYADFEADTKGKTGEVHQPFMVVIQSSDGSENKCFKGEDCAKQFLNYLPDGAVVYFHNLSYDYCMFNRLLSSIQKIIKHGSKIYQVKASFYKKHLQFKDSLSIFMCKLAVLPSSFKLEGVKKELFPYRYYTLERLRTNKGIISEAGVNEDKVWTESDYETFRNNIDAIDGCRLNETTFDMYKYAEFYCQQDVRILRESFEKLCEGFKKEFDIDVRTKLTTPSVAYEYFRQKVFIPNGNIYETGGHVRAFMSRAVYGGRCMCAFNRKWHSTRPIYDYDAVSLYPSAMNRLWTVEGKPEVLNHDTSIVYNCMPDYLMKYNTVDGIGAFVIEIQIVKVHKHYAFPLIVQHTKEGNLNKDTDIDEEHPVNMVVDNIMLEDLIEFQKIEFKVVKGYVWNGKRDYKIRDVIKYVFDKRCEYKKAKNPLQELYKLIMNSAYGKTIQKPVEYDLKYLSKWKSSDNKPCAYERYWQKNYNKIVEVVCENDDFAIVKVQAPIDKHFNLSLFGIQVLSMSKRIMNEVMCLAYDLRCHVYYQDTDSMHIECDDLPRLEEAFKQKYGRELRGSEMGRFHSDFPTINKHEEIPRAIESYFIAKKLYIDKLQDSTGEVDFMVRGKGLTQNCIFHKANEVGDLMTLYNMLFEGERVKFDLCDGSPCFDMRADFTVATRQQFTREASTDYKLGDRDHYFTD